MSPRDEPEVTWQGRRHMHYRSSSPTTCEPSLDFSMQHYLCNLLSVVKIFFFVYVLQKSNKYVRSEFRNSTSWVQSITMLSYKPARVWHLAAPKQNIWLAMRSLRHKTASRQMQGSCRAILCSRSLTVCFRHVLYSASNLRWWLMFAEMQFMFGILSCIHMISFLLLPSPNLYHMFVAMDAGGVSSFVISMQITMSLYWLSNYCVFIKTLSSFLYIQR